MQHKIKYGEGVNWQDSNSSHARMVNLVGRDKSVLEFGCSTGYMSRVLKENGCRVVGVEIDPDAAQQATAVCDRVIVSDAERGNWAEQLKNERFQVVVFGDVLEHLTDPLSVLRSVRRLVSEDGYVVASIPNIAHGSVRLALLSGEFVYRKLGLLDDTHLRFFTRETIAELFAKAGFLIEEMQRSTAGIFNVEVQPRQEFYSTELVSELQAEEDALTYQYICKAVPAEHEMLVEKISAELRETQRELKSTRISLAALRQEHATAVTEKDTAISDLQSMIAVRDDTLHALLNSKGWRMLERYRSLRNAFRSSFAGLTRTATTIPSPPVGNAQKSQYERWIERHESSVRDLDGIGRTIASFAYAPKISIVMPVYETPQDLLEKAIASVRQQDYENWELCIHDDGSKKEYIKPVLQSYAEADQRIHVSFSAENEGISNASNRALGLATGEFVGLLDHDDELSRDALYEVVKLLQSDPKADMVYSDEDKLGPDGSRCDPFFKPDWSPELLLSFMYTCHFGVYRRELLSTIGGFRKGFEGSQDYDLVLRLSEHSDRIRHVPRILYHWRMTPASTAASFDSKPQSHEAAKRALAEHLGKRGCKGTVVDGEWPNRYRVCFPIKDAHHVTIIIPTRDQVRLLRTCITSIENKTIYPNFDVLVIDNGSSDAETLKYLSGLSHKVLKFPEPFNFSRILNHAARHTGADYLVFLNNDTEVIAPEWITAMMEFCQLPEIGAVGAKLLYTDGTIQHAGVILGIGGVAGHAFKRFPDKTGHYFGAAGTIRNYSAVTAACMMVRKKVFDEVGGFNEELSVAFNDVDFCLRVRQAGYRIVWTPYAKLYHHESATRGFALDAEEVAYMRSRWGTILRNDPYYNANLSRTHEDFSLNMEMSPYHSKALAKHRDGRL